MSTGKPSSTDHKAPSPDVDVAIVGGGVAGLYCCLQLFNRYSSAGDAEPLKTVALFEGSSRLGGRIESWRIDPKRYDGIRNKSVKSSPGTTSVLHQMEKQDEAQRDAESAQAAPVPLDDFMVAEFGPMRVEPAHQPFLRRLLEDLQIVPEAGPYRKWSDQVPFSPYASQPPADPAFHLDGEEAEQTTILDLMLLALRRIFESVEIVDGDTAITESPWRLGNPDDPADAQDRDTPYHELNHFWHEMRDDRFLHRRYWQRYMRDWINLLRDEHYQVIRTRARFLGTPLHQMGFWNVLGSVLSHMATVKLRDWGSFYHLVGDNPSAAEWIIFWLRAMRSTDALVGIRGGMDWIVYKACAQLGFRRDESDARNESGEDGSPLYHSGIGHTAPNQVQAQLWMEMTLRKVRETEGEPIELTFESHGHIHIVRAKQVILALPQAPLQNVAFESSRDAAAQSAWNQAFAIMLDAVMPIPLLKVFMVVDNPFWEDNRPANQYAYTVPSREVHYWKSAEQSVLVRLPGKRVSRGPPARARSPVDRAALETGNDTRHEGRAPAAGRSDHLVVESGRGLAGRLRQERIGMDDHQVRQRSPAAHVSVLRAREPCGERFRRSRAGGRPSRLGSQTRRGRLPRLAIGHRPDARHQLSQRVLDVAVGVEGEVAPSRLRRGVFGLPGVHRGGVALGSRGSHRTAVRHQQGPTALQRSAAGTNAARERVSR